MGPRSFHGLSQSESSLAGIVYMCAGVFCLVLNDTCAKWLGEHYTVLQVAFLRSAVACPIVMLIAVGTGGFASLKTPRPLFHIGRGLLSTGAVYSFFLGLTLLPLAEATAIIFSAPLFVTVLSIVILGEHVGPRRWAAVIVGFIGVLVIVQPGVASFQPAALIVAGTAVFYALLMITVRMRGQDESIWTLMFYMTLVPLVVTAVTMPAVWRTPEIDHLPIILAMGAAGAAAFSLITLALRSAPAAVVAPFDYTALIWASLMGWLLWREIPGPWTIVGAACIVASGIYVTWRESRVGASSIRARQQSGQAPRG